VKASPLVWSVLWSVSWAAACDPIAGAISPSWPAFPDPSLRGPEPTCQARCAAHAKACREDDCRRGCGLVLDRLAERQGDTVVACVAASAPRCDDRAWAACAARIGPHADGGPPAPPPPSDDIEE
jgi:hypothetical protein